MTLKAKVVKTDRTVEGSKRNYVPATIEWTCPQCGKRNEEDFGRQYLSYPTIAGEMSDAGWEETHLICFYCEEKRYEDDDDRQYEFPILVRVKMILEFMEEVND